MRAFCGIDWASDHHDIAVVDETGSLLARARIDDSAEGLDQLLQMLAEHGDSPQDSIPVAIETSRGLLVACLRATGRPVYAINPWVCRRPSRTRCQGEPAVAGRVDSQGIGHRARDATRPGDAFEKA
ncbi:IS110 family transposase [Streptomyces sp. NBC_00273]|nr:transposase [Streptomyces sp. NBC_00273]